MKSESVKLQNVEELLLPLAEKHTPEGTEQQAVVDQWVHAIATDSQFFCNLEINNPTALKSEVLSLLQEHGLYKNTEDFYELVFSDLKLKPSKKPSFKFIDLFAGIGGIRLGFQSAGGACVFSSEFDRHAQDTYKKIMASILLEI